MNCRGGEIVVCRRCGECCRYFALPFSFEGMPSRVESMMVDFLVKRGFILDNGYLVIPSECPKLYYDDNGVAVCRLQAEGKKPLVCRNYPLPGDWTPKVCVYASNQSQQEEEGTKKQVTKRKSRVSSVVSGN